MGWATGIAAALAAIGGVANNVAQNKARGQARFALSQQMQQAEADRQNRIEQFNAGLAEQRKMHNDNMANAERTLALNREAMENQVAQSQAGLAMQSAAMEQQRADSQRQLDMQKSQLERSINTENRGTATFKRPDAGVSGTILTGPMGVEKDKIKKSGTILLGGV